MDVLQLKIKDIEQKRNSRSLSAEDVSSLMVSLRTTGQLQPIGVRRQQKGYEVIFGNRRLEAARKLGWEYIDAVVTDRPAGEVEAEKELVIKNAVENLQRKNPSFEDQGRMFTELMDKYSMTPAEIAAATASNLSTVRNIIAAFQRFPKEYRGLIVNPGRSGGNRRKDGEIPLNAAKAALNILKIGKLQPKEKEKLLQYTKKKTTSVEHLRKIQSAVKNGEDFSVAISELGVKKNFSVSIMLSPKEIKAVEKHTGYSVGHGLRVIMKEALEEII